MTNFFVCNIGIAESTPRQGDKPSAECKADSESKTILESIPTDSESKQLTESTTLKNLIKALPNTNSACGSTRPKQNLKI
ncbi:hypothetical protein [uncultured Helicobacter sp.]|uniref:hypothetical protein n=1 Tax=uncultured Helicobacter sp. TaxID=175537 RepID=UPI0037507108